MKWEVNAMRQWDNEIWSLNIIEHEKNFFLKNHTQNTVEKLATPKPFSKISELSISLDKQFLLYVQSRAIEIYLN